MKDSTFSVVFNSDILTVKHIVSDALNYLCSYFPRISSEEFFDFKLLMSEVLSNAVIHGNNGDYCKKVSFKMKVVGDNSVLLQVVDEGTGFELLPFSNVPVNDKSLMSESGRGLVIISSLADEIISNGMGNEIKIYKKVVSHEA